tara:strand:- start:14070 stop:14582 length:513 start_codon:yes stop_codon:yes gene_type:complete
MNINVTDTKHIKGIINKAAEVFDIPLTALLSKSRKQDLNIARMCIANIAMEEHSMHKDLIAEALSRDRCSIYYYEKQHKAQYSNWAKYRNSFNLLHSNLFIGVRKTIRKSEILRMLKEGKLKPYNGAVTILITSGSSSHKFKTSYADMCENVEKIKEIFSDHDVNIDIQI